MGLSAAFATVPAFAIEQADYFGNPISWVFSVFVTIVLVYCAYRTAVGRHWILFFLGFCFPLLWIIGAVIGPREYDV